MRDVHRYMCVYVDACACKLVCAPFFCVNVCVGVCVHVPVIDLRMDGPQAFVGFTEGEYLFPPTFKVRRKLGFEYTVSDGGEIVTPKVSSNIAHVRGQWTFPAFIIVWMCCLCLDGIYCLDILSLS